MKYLFTLLGCAVFCCGFAETIQNVEYSLPKESSNWVVGNKLEHPQATTIIYIPAGVERQKAEEFFGVNANRIPSNPSDTSGIKLGLNKMHPGMTIDFNILEKEGDSALYEWSAKKNGIEQFHGFGRVFSNKEGTVVLGFQTKKISEVHQARALWLPALKAAKKTQLESFQPGKA